MFWSVFIRDLVLCTSVVCLLAESFRYYFTGSSTLLFTFPSRYLFTIGLIWYLALERGRPSFLPEFAVSDSTQEHPMVLINLKYTTLTFFGQPFQVVLLSIKIQYWSPTTPLAFYLRKNFEAKKPQFSNTKFQTIFMLKISMLKPTLPAGIKN